MALLLESTPKGNIYWDVEDAFVPVLKAALENRVFMKVSKAGRQKQMSVSEIVHLLPKEFQQFIKRVPDAQKK